MKEESIIDDASITSIRDGVTNKLKEAYDQMKKNEVHEYYQRKISEPEAVTITPTAVPLENLRSINADLLKWPENFNVYHVKWITTSKEQAVCIYTYHWKGIYQGELAMY